MKILSRNSHRNTLYSSSYLTPAFVTLLALSGILNSATQSRADNECGTTTPIECADPSYTSGISYTNVDDFDLQLIGTGTSVTGGITVTAASAATSEVKIDLKSSGGTVSGVSAAAGVGAQHFEYPGVVWLKSTGASTGNMVINLSDSTTITTASKQHGMMNYAADSSNSSYVSISMSGGTISLNGDDSYGAFAYTAGDGGAYTYNAGATIESSGTSNTVGLVSQSTNSSGLAESTLAGGTIDLDSYVDAAYGKDFLSFCVDRLLSYVRPVCAGLILPLALMEIRR